MMQSAMIESEHEMMAPIYRFRIDKWESLCSETMSVEKIREESSEAEDS